MVRHMLSLMWTKRRSASISQKLSPLALTIESRRASVMGLGSVRLSLLMDRVPVGPSAITTSVAGRLLRWVTWPGRKTGTTAQSEAARRLPRSVHAPRARLHDTIPRMRTPGTASCACAARASTT